jgi:hypothetical protein
MLAQRMLGGSDRHLRDAQEIVRVQQLDVAELEELARRFGVTDALREAGLA